MILDNISTNDYDQWCDVVNIYINDMILPLNFISHCCEIEHFSKGLMPIQDISSNFFVGWVFLSQLMLLIDSPMHGNIDIHGFGKGDKTYPLLFMVS